MNTTYFDSYIQRKFLNNKMAAVLKKRFEYLSYARRMETCANTIEMGKKLCPDTGEISTFFHSAWHCHVRFCPICGGQRTVYRRRLQVAQRLKPIIEQGRMGFVSLTLTDKNCPVSNLANTIKALNKAFKTLLKQCPFIKGSLAAIEITRPQDGYVFAHPHIHCLLIVPQRYFYEQRNKEQDWTLLWQNCLGVDYLPHVTMYEYIRALDRINQALNYIIKPIPDEELDYMLASPRWFLTFWEQTHSQHLFSAKGLLKGVSSAPLPKPIFLTNIIEFNRLYWNGRGYESREEKGGTAHA
jgi:plasmid rolling circle replication initiator protein Rep